MKFLPGYIETDSDRNILLLLMYDLDRRIRRVIETAAGGSAGYVERALRIGDTVSGLIIIIVVSFTVPVDKGRTGITVIMGAEHQIDIIVGSDAGQIVLAIGTGIFCSGIGRIMLGQNAPGGIGVLRDNLSDILFLDSFAPIV